MFSSLYEKLVATPDKAIPGKNLDTPERKLKVVTLQIYFLNPLALHLKEYRLNGQVVKLPAKFLSFIRFISRSSPKGLKFTD